MSRIENKRLYNGKEQESDQMPSSLQGNEVITIIKTYNNEIIWIARPADKAKELGEYRHAYLADLAVKQGLIQSVDEIEDGAVIYLGSGRRTGSGSFGDQSNPMDTIPTEMLDQFIEQITAED